MAQPRHKAPSESALGGWAPRGVAVAVRRDAAMEGVSPAIARAVFWLPTVGIPALGVLYVLYRRGFYWLLREDHPVEWSQFAFLLVATLAALAAAVRFARRRRWVLAALLVVVALGAFGMAGEEISWGQRVAGWSTPASLEASNRQGETNLHNLDIGVPVAADDIADFIELVMGVGGAALGLLARPAGGVLHRTVLWDLAPPLAAVPGFAWMAVYQSGNITAEPSAAPWIVYQEWFEFSFYGSIAATVIAVFARAARGRVLLVPAQRRGTRRSAPHAPAGMRPVVVLVVLAIAITVLFAVLTTWTGMLPGNVPSSLAN